MDIMKKLKFKFLCMAGYLYFGVLILLILGLFAGLIGLVLYTGRATTLLLKLFIPIAIFAGAIFKGFFKAIFTKLPEPDGILLGIRECPEFYNFVNDIRVKAKAPRIDAIKINYEFNALIAEVPQIGILGWNKRYLVIGLPLMLALSKQELASVIAHECGHLSKAHGKDGIRIYRAKTLWEMISEELKNTGKDRIFLIRIFMHRYIVALNDIYFETKRLHEYDADRIAVSVSGNEAFAAALIKVSLYEEYLSNTFWTKIKELNLECERVPDDIYFQMEKACLEQLPIDFSQKFIESLLKYRSLPSDTHPAYIERLEAFDVSIPVIEAHRENSIRSILGNKADIIIDTCSRGWVHYASEKWREYYKNMRNAKDRLILLNSAYTQRMFDLKETMERIELIESVEGVDNAILALKEAKQVFPDNGDIDYNLGRLLLYKDQEDGVDILKGVMDKEFQLIPACSYELVNYFCRNDQRDSAAEYYHLAVKVMETNENIKAERESVLSTDYFIPHDLSYDTICNIINSLKKFKEIKKAYVVVKYAKMSGQFPVYLIGVRYKFSMSGRWKSVQQEILESGLLPWEHWVFNLNKRREFEYMISMIPGSRII